MMNYVNVCAETIVIKKSQKCQHCQRITYGI